MLELGTFGSVRGVPGDGYPYRNPRSTASGRRATKRTFDKVRCRAWASEVDRPLARGAANVSFEWRLTFDDES